MAEINFPHIANKILIQEIQKTQETICNYHNIVCRDIIAGKNGDFWFRKSSRIEHKKDLKISTENNIDEKTIVIVLESPHKDEFMLEGTKNDFFDNEIKANPALGRTGDNLQKFFDKKKLESILGDEYLESCYRIILMNCVQYQCSLGVDTKRYRDHIWLTTWFKNGGIQDFAKRLKMYNPDIIINLCTQGDHSNETNVKYGCKSKINDKYLKHCLGEDFSIPTELDSSNKEYTLRGIVTSYIKIVIEEITQDSTKEIHLYEGTHPSSWKGKKYTEKFDRIL